MWNVASGGGIWSGICHDMWCVAISVAFGVWHFVQHVVWHVGFRI